MQDPLSLNTYAQTKSILDKFLTVEKAMELIKALVDKQFSPTEEEMASWERNSEVYFIETKYECFNMKRKYSAHIVQDICKKYPDLAVNILSNLSTILSTAATKNADAVVVKE
jgi:hypothetical protein